MRWVVQNSVPKSFSFLSPFFLWVYNVLKLLYLLLLLCTELMLLFERIWLRAVLGAEMCSFSKSMEAQRLLLSLALFLESPCIEKGTVSAHFLEQLACLFPGVIYPFPFSQLRVLLSKHAEFLGCQLSNREGSHCSWDPICCPLCREVDLVCLCIFFIR